jgi:hypothetical protein
MRNLSTCFPNEDCEQAILDNRSSHHSNIHTAIAIAYIHGVEEGINSQQYRIKLLEEQLHPELIIDYFPYFHPLRNAVGGIACLLALCWLGIAAIVLMKIKSQT